jgi:hypothetical protein
VWAREPWLGLAIQPFPCPSEVCIRGVMNLTGEVGLANHLATPIDAIAAPTRRWAAVNRIIVASVIAETTCDQTTSGLALRPGPSFGPLFNFETNCLCDLAHVSDFDTTG